MPRIRFTADPKLPRDIAHLGYEKGQEVDLSTDQAERWLRRGVAVAVQDQSELALQPDLPHADDPRPEPEQPEPEPDPVDEAVIDQPEMRSRRR